MSNSAVFSITPHHFERLSESGDVERAGNVIEWDPTLAATPPNPNLMERIALQASMQSVVSRQRADALLCTTADYDLVPQAVRNVYPSIRFWPKKSAGVIHFGFPKGNLGRDGLGLPRDGTYVGCVGMMDRRKAVPELVQAFLSADFGPETRLVLAGRIDSDYRRLIDSEYSEHVRSGRFILIDRALSDVEISCGYAALDLHSVLQYRRFNLSANVLKCVASNKPFVCDEIGFASMVARRFDAGIACDVRDVGSIAAALAAGIEKSRLTTENAGAGRLREFHSYENFARTALASVLGAEVFNVLGPATNWAHAYGPRGRGDGVPDGVHALDPAMSSASGAMN